MSKMYSQRRFSLRAYKDAKRANQCICAHFKKSKGAVVAVAPFNRSCPVHGERAQG